MIDLPFPCLNTFLISCITFSFLFSYLVSSLTKMRLIFYTALGTPTECKMLESEANDKMSLLDLPDLALENILERLSPAELGRMAGVCSCLRKRSTSDYMWKRHMTQKWGRVVGHAAYRNWQCHVANSNKKSLVWSKIKGLFGWVFSIWPLAKARLESESIGYDGCFPMDDSIMTLYLSLESGKFWFPAQVYNRENGHGFLLSCYDAVLSYNSATDTFRARYSPRGRNTIEENVAWDRLRAPPVDTPAYSIHTSDCLEDLKPKDHIEIQWRRSIDYPYGWWYGVVGHLDSCIRAEGCCQCHENDSVMIEFNQYPVDSRFRRTTLSRKNHREEGNEGDGFYGGIRKLCDENEINKWKSVWPKNTLDQ